MLHPRQFEVNEAWIAFKLNDSPIHTERDGDFDFIALMDAGSCFILSSAPVPAELPELTQLESKQLLKQARTHKKRWAKMLFVPIGQPARFLSDEAKRQGIEVIWVPEDQLLVFIGEARDEFKGHFGGGDAN